MIDRIKIAFALIVVVFGSCSKPDPLQLCYDTPAQDWMQALPIGNGRLGAMIWGGVDEDHLSINESTLWSGQQDSTADPIFGRERLDSLRALFFADKITEGNVVAWHTLTGNEQHFGSHVPLGDLVLRFDHDAKEQTNYSRRLNIRHGVAITEYDCVGVHYRRRYVCSHVDSVLIVDLQANRPQALNITLSWHLLRPEASVFIDKSDIVVSGRATQPGRTQGGVDFACRTHVVADQGTISPLTDSLGHPSFYVSHAHRVRLYIDLRTSYCSSDYDKLCLQTVTTAAKGALERQIRRHAHDVASLMDRVSLRLGNNQRDVLFFQYARYLTIATSRTDSPLPIALQAMFNDNRACNMGWNNDYHLDINTEQNYWLTGVGNLAECDMPLMRYIETLSHSGHTTASKVYGCSGWTTHTTSNAWGFTAPSGCIAWGLFPTAGSWLATHLWSHYIYTGDTIWLREQGYPLLKGNARFLMDYMTYNPYTGYMVTGPSISPENAFFDKKGQRCCASMMPTIDRVLVAEVWNDCIDAATILHTDVTFVDSIKHSLSLLPPLQENYYGGIREWLDDYREAEPHHRHTSHLLALYPFHQITPQMTPELSLAAEKTLQHRYNAVGWEDVEWSRANAVCFYARLGKAEEAYQHLIALQTGLCGKNLFTISPAGIAGAKEDIYAFDGNTAGAAGIAEMLIQYIPPVGAQNNEIIYLLPALPQAWQEGSFSGLCVPGLEMDATWQKDGLISASAQCRIAGAYTFVLPNGKQTTRAMKCGERLSLTTL